MPALTYQSAYDGAVADANLGHRLMVAAGVTPTDAQILAAIKAAWSAVAGT